MRGESVTKSVIGANGSERSRQIRLGQWKYDVVKLDVIFFLQLHPIDINIAVLQRNEIIRVISYMIIISSLPYCFSLIGQGRLASVRERITLITLFLLQCTVQCPAKLPETFLLITDNYFTELPMNRFEKNFCNLYFTVK